MDSEATDKPADSLAEHRARVAKDQAAVIKFRRTKTYKRLRAQRALEIYTNGATYAMVAAALDLTPSQAQRLIHNELARRAEADDRTADQARALYRERMELLIRTWLPVAVGDDEEPPNLKASGHVLDIIKTGIAMDGAAAPKHSTHDHTIRQATPEEHRAQVLEQLKELTERQRHPVIEGETL